MPDVVYKADGLTMTGHLALPAGDGPWPSVLLAHDGVGLESYQRSRADELAKLGYVAFAMDYHGGEVFLGMPEAMLARTMPLLRDVDRMRAIGHAAVDQLLAQPGVDCDRLAALGYGAGALVALEVARTGVAFKALALVHPALPDPDDDDWAALAGAFLLCTGSEDPIVTADQVLTFGRTLQRLGLDWRANIYGGAEHAFWAPQAGGGDETEDRAVLSLATVSGVGRHPIQAARAWTDVLRHFSEIFG